MKMQKQLKKTIFLVLLFIGVSTSSLFSQELYLDAVTDQIRIAQNMILKTPSSPILPDVLEILEKQIKTEQHKALDPETRLSIEKAANKLLRTGKLISKLAPCLDGKTDSRNMLSQLTQGAFNYDCECENPEVLGEELKQNISDIQAVSKEAQKEIFIGEARVESVATAMKAFSKYDLVFGDGIKSLDSYMKDLCGACSEGDKNKVKALVAEHLKDLRARKKEGLKTYTQEEVYAEMQKRVKSLNQSMDEVHKLSNPTREQRIKMGSAAFKKQADEQYEFYKQKYIQMTTDDLGSLFLTEEAQSFMKGLRSKDELSSTVRGKGKAYSPHSAPEPYCMDQIKGTAKCNKRKKDAFKKLIEQAKKRVKAHLNSTIDEENQNIKKMLKLNPLAVGRALMKYPEMFSEVCDEVGNIATEDEKTKRKEEIINGALNTISIVSMAFGGAGLLVKGATTGGKMLLSKVAANSVKIGVTSSLGNLGVGLKRQSQYQEEYNDVMNARYAEAVTPSEYERAMEYEEAYEKAKSQALMSGLELVPFGIIHKVRKLRLAKNAKRLAGGLDHKNIAKTLENVTPSEAKFLKNLESSGKATADQVESLLVSISNLPLQKQRDALYKLKWLEQDPKQLKSFFEEVQRTVNQCII